MAQRQVPAVVWLAWAVAAAASIQLAPNPLYVSVVVAVAALVVEGHARDGPLASAFPLLVGAGIFFALLRVVLTVLTTHGSGRVLFRLPEATLPTLFGGFTVGGTIEAPVLARSLSEGWALVGILAVFGAFNAVVSHYDLVRSAPRAFYEVGLAVTVALAFVPSTLAALGAVREADAARTGGVVVRKGRLLRQLLPILETGMERAVALAESMDSRGFGHQAPTRHDAVSSWLSLCGLLALGGCIVALVAGSAGVALVLAGAGAGALVSAVAIASRGRRRVSYHPRRVRPVDWWPAAVAWMAPLTLGLLSLRDDPSLVWAGPDLTLPGLNLVALGALALLVAPAVLAPPGRRLGPFGDQNRPYDAPAQPKRPKRSSAGFPARPPAGSGPQ